MKMRVAEELFIMDIVVGFIIGLTALYGFALFLFLISGSGCSWAQSRGEKKEEKEEEENKKGEPEE